MTRTISIAGICALLAATTLAQTPALPSVDTVLDNYVKAVGGRAAIEKITTATAKGTLDIADAGVTGTVTLSQKAPNKQLQVTELAGLGVQREGFDGTVAWSDDPQNGVREKTDAELTETRRGSMFPRELRLREMYPKLAVTAREKVGTRDAIVLVGTPAEGTPVRMYFDAETWMLIRQVSTRQSTMGPIEVDSTFEDYRAIDGVKRAHVIRQTNSQFSAVVRLSEIKHNVALDDAIFRKPGG